MEERDMQMLERMCVEKEGHRVIMLTMLQKMTMLWIKNGNADTIPLSHTGLVSGILVDYMSANVIHKPLLKCK